MFTFMTGALKTRLIYVKKTLKELCTKNGPFWAQQGYPKRKDSTSPLKKPQLSH
jgi:hypothetical protein